MLKISQSTQGGSSVWKHGADVADEICFVRNKRLPFKACLDYLRVGQELYPGGVKKKTKQKRSM